MNNLVNLKSFFQFLSKNKSYTFIDVFGLSVSLMFVILIATYTYQELSTDDFQENAENIYILSNEEYIGSAYRLSDRLLERYPEIEKTCAMTNIFQSMAVEIGDLKLNASLLLADTTFFQMFSFDLIEGNKYDALSAKNYAIISETFSNKAFPDRDPIGQVIKLSDEVSLIVNGIMKDIKNSCIPYSDILFRMENVKYFNPSMDSEGFNNSGSTAIFVQTKPGADIQARSEDVADYFREIFWQFKRGIYSVIQFIPMKEVYFSSIETGELLNKGDWKFVIILLSVGIVILIFAIINYINLTVAQTGFRAKEMATRRLLGSSRWELFLRLMLESTVLTFISFVLGVFLAFTFIPYANDLIETQIDLWGVITPLFVVVAIGSIILIGCVAGLLPAIIISNSKPVDVVKGAFRKKTKMVFSKVFITFQNAITITLIGVSITMILQNDHLMKAPLGYNTVNLVDIPCENISSEQAIMIGKELQQLASVKRVSWSEGTPFDGGNNQTVIYEGKNVSLQMLIGDTTYFNMLGFEILRENHLATSDGFYLTEQAIREFGITEDTPKIHIANNNWDINIAGIIKDFHLGNITLDLRPVMVQIRKAEDFDWGVWNLLVEVQGDNYVALDQIKSIYESISNLSFEGKFIDRQIADSFASQRRTSKIVMVFAFIAIVISLLGLLAMSTYFIQQRAREVAVRKVFGSNNQQVLFSLIRTFLYYVLFAFVFATPVIFYFMSQWLSEYTYRIVLSPFIFLAAGFFCLLVSFLTVFWQSRVAANANPAISIKSE